MIDPGRRKSRYFVPIACTARRAEQRVLNLDERDAEGRAYTPNDLVDEIRSHVETWRSLPQEARIEWHYIAHASPVCADTNAGFRWRGSSRTRGQWQRLPPRAEPSPAGQRLRRPARAAQCVVRLAACLDFLLPTPLDYSSEDSVAVPAFLAKCPACGGCGLERRHAGVAQTSDRGCYLGEIIR